jgi:hypothetical protein
MTFFTAKPADPDKSTESAVETEIRESVRHDGAGPHRSPETDREAGESNISTSMQRIAGSSIAEIDRLTSELQSLRELLQSEGARVQRELTEYARLNQSAMQSTRLISERLADCRNKDALARRG